MDMFDDSLCMYLHSYCILMNILILILCLCITSNKLTYFKVMVGSNISVSMDVSGDQSMLQSHVEHREEPLLGE